jgi:pilus assembly protein CpaE
VPITITVVGARDPRVEDLLRATDHAASTTWISVLDSLLQADAPQPDILVLDVRGQGRLPSTLALLKRKHPSINVILIASTIDGSLMLEAMRAGVNECVAEPLAQADMSAAVTRLLGQRTTAVAGAVFAFVGAKGGVGTTTMAVNVATSLASVSAGRTILIDLHVAYGDAAVFLGAGARFSIVDAVENLHRFDGAFFNSLLARTPSGVDLLASADRLAAKPIDSKRLASVVEFAATQYQYTVLDVPRSDTTVLDSLDHASTIVVVANQELATVTNAGSMSAALRSRYRKAKVMTVINRSDRRSEIGQQDIERAVGGTISFQVPSDYRRALHAIHQGRPLVLDNHNELSASFKALAQELAGVKRERSAAERPTGLIGRLSGRRS